MEHSFIPSPEKLLAACRTFQDFPADLANELAARGWTPTPPDDLDDSQLPSALRRLVADLAALDVFLEETDHLDDRALYARLLEEMRAPGGLHWPGGVRTSTTLLLNGSRDDASIDVWLRYYASPTDRAWWAEAFPDDPLPEAEPPPYPRDWIPQAPEAREGRTPSLFAEEGR